MNSVRVFDEFEWRTTVDKAVAKVLLDVKKASLAGAWIRLRIYWEDCEVVVYRRREYEKKYMYRMEFPSREVLKAFVNKLLEVVSTSDVYDFDIVSISEETEEPEVIDLVV